MAPTPRPRGAAHFSITPVLSGTTPLTLRSCCTTSRPGRRPTASSSTCVRHCRAHQRSRTRPRSPAAAVYVLGHVQPAVPSAPLHTATRADRRSTDIARSRCRRPTTRAAFGWGHEGQRLDGAAAHVRAFVGTVIYNRCPGRSAEFAARRAGQSRPRVEEIRDDIRAYADLTSGPATSSRSRTRPATVLCASWDAGRACEISGGCRRSRGHARVHRAEAGFERAGALPHDDVRGSNFPLGDATAAASRASLVAAGATRGDLMVARPGRLTPLAPSSCGAGRRTTKLGRVLPARVGPATAGKSVSAPTTMPGGEDAA